MNVTKPSRELIAGITKVQIVIFNMLVRLLQVIIAVPEHDTPQIPAIATLTTLRERGPIADGGR